MNPETGRCIFKCLFVWIFSVEIWSQSLKHTNFSSILTKSTELGYCLHSFLKFPIFPLKTLFQSLCRKEHLKFFEIVKPNPLRCLKEPGCAFNRKVYFYLIIHYNFNQQIHFNIVFLLFILVQKLILPSTEKLEKFGPKLGHIFFNPLWNS